MPGEEVERPPVQRSGGFRGRGRAEALVPGVQEQLRAGRPRDEPVGGVAILGEERIGLQAVDPHRYALRPGGAELRAGDAGVDRERALGVRPGPRELLDGERAEGKPA